MNSVAKEHCCQEASILSRMFYIPCNKPATQVIGWAKYKSVSGQRSAELREGPYRMCEECANHSIKNRGAHSLGPYTEDFKIVERD